MGQTGRHIRGRSAFADNDIDFAILGELTDQDLEKAGVALLDHRRKLLPAIAGFLVVEKGTHHTA
jgi:SAM domain (Sterile alpha motif)